MDKVIDLAWKLGGWLALVGALIGGYLAYPRCTGVLSTQTCKTVLYGTVAPGEVTPPDVMGPAAAGAVILGAIGFVLGKAKPHHKENLGINDEDIL